MDSATTDCRSEEGVTYGLIDAIISIARVARHRDLSPDVVQQALADLRDDEDVAFLLQIHPSKIRCNLCAQDGIVTNMALIALARHLNFAHGIQTMMMPFTDIISYYRQVGD